MAIQTPFGSETNLSSRGHTLRGMRSSDGAQPHFITVEFPRKVAIQVCPPFLYFTPHWQYLLNGLSENQYIFKLSAR